MLDHKLAGGVEVGASFHVAYLMKQMKREVEDVQTTSEDEPMVSYRGASEEEEEEVEIGS